MSSKEKLQRKKARSKKRKLKKARELNRQAKLMRYLAKPGRVNNLILIPVNKILASNKLKYFDKLIYGELYTIFNSCSQFQLNRKLLSAPINSKKNGAQRVTTALHHLEKLRLIVIKPVNDKSTKSKKAIGYIVFNTGLNKVTEVNKQVAKANKQNKKVTKRQKIKEQTKFATTRKVIDFLNKEVGSRYRYAKGSEKLIIGRLNDGYSIDDFKTVISFKAKEWIGTKWQSFLRPSTLFRPSNFDNYLNAARMSREYHNKAKNSQTNNQQVNEQNLQKRGYQSHGIDF